MMGQTSNFRKLLHRMWDARFLYLLLLPLMLYYILFHYVPMYGIVLAFKEYNFDSILGSPWVGFKNFQTLFSLPQFKEVLINTFQIAFGRLLFEFPIPIIVALLLNEVGKKKLKRFYQTVYTFPHFLSWVIISGILLNFLGSKGVFNQILLALGLHKQTLLTSPDSFKPFIFISNIWKEMGWGTIIYLATITGISPELYEAASIDGAGRFNKMRYVTLPSLIPTIGVLLILALGNIMGGAGFDQIFNMDNAAVRQSSEVIDTYIYRSSFFLGMTFSFTTAVGLFKSVINAVMLLLADTFLKSRGHGGIF